MSLPKSLLFVVGLSTSYAVFAAAPVSEIGQTQQPASAVAPQVPSVPPAEAQPPARDVHYQMQLLQDEVRTLRGMVEELNNEIRQLKKRQMDDYMDVDRRLSSLLSGQAGRPSLPANVNANTNTVVKSSSKSGVNSAVVSSTNTSKAAAPAVNTDEANNYNSAYKLLKDGKVNDAVGAFKEHIAKYPQGKYVANAHYWLGEIYVLQNELELARQSFTVVLDNYPIHRKAPDSTFKLGQVYFMLGNKAKAKELLEKVAAGNDNAARLAQSYLDKNF